MRPNRACRRDTVDGVEVFRVWTSQFGRDKLIGRAVDYASFYLFAALSLRRFARPGDIVIAKTDPPLLSVVIAPIARWRGARLVNWLQDLFPEIAEAVGFDRRQVPVSSMMHYAPCAIGPYAPP